MTGRHAAPQTGRHRKRVRETSDYVAFLLRAVDAYGRRVAADPAGLVHYRGIEQRLRDAVNLAVHDANRGPARYSLAEQAAILGITRQSLHQRVRLGAALVDAADVIRLADVRAARAAALAEAGVQDRGEAGAG